MPEVFQEMSVDLAASHRFVSPRLGMLPLVHPEGGILLEKPSVPAGTETLSVSRPQRKKQSSG
jgi:hypothetical protein